MKTLKVGCLMELSGGVQMWKVLGAYLPWKSSNDFTTDASILGWGAYVVNEQSTGGRWTETEHDLHINVLELQAVFLGLQALCY